MDTSSRRLLIVMAALSALLAIPSAAFAYAPTGDDFITCVAGGDTNVECVSGEFEANTACTFEVSTGATGSGTSDADGEFAFDFDVATGEETDVEVTVQCGSKVLSAMVAAVTADGDVIANAGADSMTLVTVALAALGVGGSILAVSRRRRTSTGT